MTPTPNKLKALQNHLETMEMPRFFIENKLPKRRKNSFNKKLLSLLAAASIGGSHQPIYAEATENSIVNSIPYKNAYLSLQLTEGNNVVEHTNIDFSDLFIQLQVQNIPAILYTQRFTYGHRRDFAQDAENGNFSLPPVAAFLDIFVHNGYDAPNGGSEIDPVIFPQPEILEMRIRSYLKLENDSRDIQSIISASGDSNIQKMWDAVQNNQEVKTYPLNIYLATSTANTTGVPTDNVQKTRTIPYTSFSPTNFADKIFNQGMKNIQLQTGKHLLLPKKQSQLSPTLKTINTTPHQAQITNDMSLKIFPYFQIISQYFPQE